MGSDRQKVRGGVSLWHALKGKSRVRRERISAFAASSPASNPTRNDPLPKLELVDRAPDALVMPARNVRKIEPAHLQEVVNAISNFGLCVPVLIDGHDNVVDGVIRIEAARLLGLPYVPCIRVDHLNADETRALRLALNRLSEKKEAGSSRSSSSSLTTSF